ncbi:MAG TPA: glycosyltransferase family 1 protein [Bryobacteraceae bacterium]|nr:glycosyltransferase family 1 protein [Bryobacteraceae bacterium]
MKVALDATPLTEQTGGIRRYTVELAKALALCSPQDEYTLVSDQSYQHAPLLGVSQELCSSRRWWFSGLPRWIRRHAIEVFHGTDFSVPYFPVAPSVMTVHDLSPWRTGGSARVRRRTPLLLRLGLPSMVITPSEAIRRELLDHFPLVPEEVVAIPLAASRNFHPSPSLSPSPPYFILAGGGPARKNPGVVEEAWREIKHRGIDADLKIVAGGVAEEDLPQLYSHAIAVLYPSLYEGFGLPVLEAMQCGAPVLASHDPAITETAGGAAIQLDPRNTRAWIEAMEACLDASFREQWREKGLRRAACFSWERTARQTREVYCTAIRRFHG